MSLKLWTYHLCGEAAGLHAVSVKQLIQVILMKSVRLVFVTEEQQLGRKAALFCYWSKWLPPHLAPAHHLWWASKLFLKSANRKTANSWAHSANFLSVPVRKSQAPIFLFIPHGILRGPGETDSWKKPEVENLVSNYI